MSIGKKKDKEKRAKALPDTYPEEGPATIKEAYKTLSPPAFAVWMRLSVGKKEDLKSGRTNLSKLLGYSFRRSNEILLELARKGFICVLPNGPWRRTHIVILRKPLTREFKF